MSNAVDPQVLEGLRSVTLFSAVPDKVLKRIAGNGRIVDHQENHEIVSEGDGGVGMHLILDGKAEVTVHGAARRTLGPGDYFGEIALIDGHRRSASVVARSPLRTWTIAQWAFGQLLDDQPGLARALLVGLCTRLREAEA